MALTDYKITDSQISTKGVVAAPDKLVGNAQENKQVFDRLIREAVKGDINGLIDALESLGFENTVLLPTSAGMKYIRLNDDKVLETSEDGTNWEATGSSGHIILDKDGNVMTQRSRLKFANSTVQDVDGVTVVNGVKGDTGDIGPQGPQGIQGIQGPQGVQGYVFVPSIDDDGVISWEKQSPSETVPASRNIRGPQGTQGIQGVQGATGSQGPQGIQGVQGIQGERGLPGADGTSFTIKGMYSTLAALVAAHPTGSAGDAYAVGTAASNTVYNWNVDTSLWEDLGPLRGPQGPQGEQGIQGIQGQQGPQGVQGEQGPQGVQGVQGEEGPQGPAGPNTVGSSTATNLTGLLKGNGSSVGVATAGTDYQAPLTAGTDYATPAVVTATQQMMAPILADPAGQAVSSGNYFIYNNVLRKAKQAISAATTAATFTGSSYSEVVSDGAANDLKSALDALYTDVSSLITVVNSRATITAIYAVKDGGGWVHCNIAGTFAATLSAAQNTIFYLSGAAVARASSKFIGNALVKDTVYTTAEVTSVNFVINHGGVVSGDSFFVSISWKA